MLFKRSSKSQPLSLTAFHSGKIVCPGWPLQPARRQPDQSGRTVFPQSEEAYSLIPHLFHETEAAEMSRVLRHLFVESPSVPSSQISAHHYK